MLYQRKFNVKSSKTGRRMNRRRLCWSSVSLPRRWRAPAVAGRSVAVSRGSSWTNALRTAAAAAPAAARWAATNNSRSARQRRLVMETRRGGSIEIHRSRVTLCKAGCVLNDALLPLQFSMIPVHANCRRYAFSPRLSYSGLCSSAAAARWAATTAPWMWRVRARARRAPRCWCANARRLKPRRSSDRRR